MRKCKTELKGITLIALVVTIIVLLILAGIAISLSLGNNGVFIRAKGAASESKRAELIENIKLDIIDMQIKNNGNILDDELRKTLLKYGDIQYEEDGSSIKGIKTKENGVILLSEIMLNSIEDNSNKKELLEINEDIENINTSAKVANIDKEKVTIKLDTLKESSLTGNFEKTDMVMIYASNSNNVNEAGMFEIYNIKEINESNDEIYLDKEVDTSKFNNTNCQIVKIANYKVVKIREGATITPSKYDGAAGGIVAIDAYEVEINGKIDASKSGYDSSNVAPNNGGAEAAGNTSKAGGSNKYKGGNGGRNYQGYIGYASNAVGKSGDILTTKQMYFGGGSLATKGGGIVYINCLKLGINSQYAISSNGQGGAEIIAGGGAGGTIVLNAKTLTFRTEDKDYFVGANGGSGMTEYSPATATWERILGNDGTNVSGADGADSTQGAIGGKGKKSNAGGGAVAASSAGDATDTTGGVGGSSVNWGWNAGRRRRSRRFCFNIYKYRY